MKNFTLTVLLIISFSAKAQENSEGNEKGLWSANTFFGICNVEAKDTYKINANVYGANLGREFYISRNMSVLTLLEHQTVTGDYTLGDARAFQTNKLIKVPVSTRFYTDRKAVTSLYIEIGLYGSYLYHGESEIVSEDISTSDSNLGTELGVLLNAGVSHQVSDWLAVRLSLAGQNAVMANGSDNTPDTKISNLYAFNLGAAIRF
ncbi:MAG TPA: hypothetical protein VGB50_12700 [Flavobacterium sp.]|jgi:outer membrane protein W